MDIDFFWLSSPRMTVIPAIKRHPRESGDPVAWISIFFLLLWGSIPRSVFIVFCFTKWGGSPHPREGKAPSNPWNNAFNSREPLRNPGHFGLNDYSLSSHK